MVRRIVWRFCARQGLGAAAEITREDLCVKNAVPLPLWNLGPCCKTPRHEEHIHPAVDRSLSSDPYSMHSWWTRGESVQLLEV